MSQIPLSQPDITRSEIDAVIDVLQTTTLSIGPKIGEFERRCAKIAGRRYGVGVSSGTAGLHAIMVAAGIKPGDEVITTPFSFVASANCILYVGATPVFADIDPQTLNLDPDKAAAAITPKTKAIVAVEAFGNPARDDRAGAGRAEERADSDRRRLRRLRRAIRAAGPSAPSAGPPSSDSIPTNRSPPAKAA